MRLWRGTWCKSECVWLAGGLALHLWHCLEHQTHTWCFRECASLIFLCVCHLWLSAGREAAWGAL